MIGYRPSFLVKYCWLYITPTICTGTFVFSLLKYSPLNFNNTYVYPWWAYWLGWFLAMSSLSLIPITMVYKLYRVKGTFWQRLQAICRPADDLPMMKEEMAGLYALDRVTDDEKTYSNNL
ncbi:unnamed protein product [Coregonus sp. 'balchen']|nr:unnamed protein product [Coregonus sp. 'balchen']